MLPSRRAVFFEQVDLPTLLSAAVTRTEKIVRTLVANVVTLDMVAKLPYGGCRYLKMLGLLFTALNMCRI